MLKKRYEANAYYSHNVILELYTTFGVIISTIIIAFIIYCYYKVWYNQKVKSDIIFCMSWVSILPLMLTGTFGDNVYFWALIGILLNACLKNDATKEEDNVKKKIFMLLNNCFEPDIRVYKEAKYLVETGNDVEILCIDKKNKFIDKPEDELEGIKIKRFFARTEKTTKLIEKSKIIAKLKYIIYFFWLMKFIRKVKKYLKDKEFEILHCHDLVMAFCGVLFFKNKKIVFDMHEYYVNKKNRLLNWIIQKILKYTQKRATWIVHVNNFQVKDVKQREKLVFIPNYPQKEKFKNFNRVNSEKFRISYTGYVRHYIPLLNLIKAANELENIEVSINGSGDAYEKLKEEEGKLKNFVLTGAYNHDDIAKFYENSDMLYVVYNKENKNDETAFPTKFYEAMITNTPVIVSKNTDMGDYVEKYDIGITVDGTDYLDIKAKLEPIVNNKEILKQKSENINKISSKFIWENIVRNLDKIYNS